MTPSRTRKGQLDLLRAALYRVYEEVAPAVHQHIRGEALAAQGWPFFWGRG